MKRTLILAALVLALAATAWAAFEGPVSLDEPPQPQPPPNPIVRVIVPAGVEVVVEYLD